MTFPSDQPETRPTDTKVIDDWRAAFEDAASRGDIGAMRRCFNYAVAQWGEQLAASIRHTDAVSALQDLLGVPQPMRRS